MIIEKGGFALENFLDIPKGLSSLSIPCSLQHLQLKSKKNINYNVKVNDGFLNNMTYNNIISMVKPSPFKLTKKNKIRLNKTKKNRKK